MVHMAQLRVRTWPSGEPAEMLFAVQFLLIVYWCLINSRVRTPILTFGSSSQTVQQSVALQRSDINWPAQTLVVVYIRERGFSFADNIIKV